MAHILTGDIPVGISAAKSERRLVKFEVVRIADLDGVAYEVHADGLIISRRVVR